MTPNEPERMQCMEVWGGNQATNRAILTPGLKTWVFNRPYGESIAGGDVYYLSSCASGRVTRMLLADVSGHGDDVSQMAVGLRDLMRRNVNYIRQTRFVRAMNQQFNAFGETGSFATALVSTFFAPTRTFTLCNAGHPAPFLFQRKKGTWSQLSDEADTGDEIADTPLGIVDKATYGLLAQRLDPGDMVLSFSDSLIESVNERGEQLGCDGVLRLVRSVSSESPNGLIEQLMERIRDLNRDNLQQDDTTIMLCQATGKATPIQNTLLAPFRLFGSVADRTSIA